MMIAWQVAPVDTNLGNLSTAHNEQRFEIATALRIGHSKCAHGVPIGK